jgi:hypothetical protein
MSLIQIKRIIEVQMLDINLVASKLFPDAGFPLMALQRIINGKGDLTTCQVLIFSQITGIPIGFLYSSKEWSIKTFSAKDKLKFTSGEVWCSLDVEKGASILCLPNSNNSLTHVGLSTPNVALSVYLSELTDIIIKYYQFNKY